MSTQLSFKVRCYAVLRGCASAREYSRARAQGSLKSQPSYCLQKHSRQQKKAEWQTLRTHSAATAVKAAQRTALFGLNGLFESGRIRPPANHCRRFAAQHRRLYLIPPPLKLMQGCCLRLWRLRRLLLRLLLLLLLLPYYLRCPYSFKNGIGLQKSRPSV